MDDFISGGALKLDRWFIGRTLIGLRLSTTEQQCCAKKDRQLPHGHPPLVAGNLTVPASRLNVRFPPKTDISMHPAQQTQLLTHEPKPPLGLVCQPSAGLPTRRECPKVAERRLAAFRLAGDKPAIQWFSPALVHLHLWLATKRVIA